MNASKFPRQRLAIIGGVAALAIVVLFVVYRTQKVSSPMQAPASSGMAGMDMSSGGAVAITPAQISQFGITFGTVERRLLTNDVRTVGTVVVDESRTASVTSKIGGYVEVLYVNATGQSVHSGEPVAEVYSPELIAAQEELLLAPQLQQTIGQGVVPGVPSSSFELLDAAKRRLRLLDISVSEIDEILRTGKPRRTLTLYSHATGVVVEKKVVQGQAIAAGAELLAIADLSSVWIDVQLREAEAGLVAVGTAADIEFASYPGRPYKGRVAFIYPTVAEQTRTIRARIAVANADGRLKPGMFGTVHLLTPTRVATTVPRTAIVQTGERTLVFVDMGGGKLVPRDVELGRVVGELAEVLSGLEVGQRVVTSAQFLIDAESNLGDVMRSMIGSGGKMQETGGDNRSRPETSPAQGADMRGMPGMITPPAPKPTRPPR
jgi:Cu(I)/Ag(I) efflux system membrane fusion protein